MTGGRVYLLDADTAKLNSSYVQGLHLDEGDENEVRQMLLEHLEATGSKVAKALIEKFDASRFSKVVTALKPEIFSEAPQVFAEAR